MTVLLLLLLLVALPAFTAFWAERRWQYGGLNLLSIGTPVVYHQYEASTRPVRGAHNIQPAERGDFYYYTIINYLRVAEVFADGAIIAVSQNRQRIYLAPNERNLRRASLAERLIYRPRFPRI